MERNYGPEGTRLNTPENRAATATPAGLQAAADSERILEAAAVLCDAEHNLHVQLPCMEGFIPREEGAIGIAEGITRDIALIARVSKPICFTVSALEPDETGRLRARLSRRRAQELCRERYLAERRVGDVIPARVTRLEPFGAFCDVGCGLPALLPIAALSISRIAHPADRLAVGQDIPVVITSLEERRMCLSQRELLGTWEQNAALFAPGDTVAGIVRSIEPYGVFVELTPNLAGLAEPRDGVQVGQAAGVYIKSILPDKMKLKLVIIDTHGATEPPSPPHYFITEGHLDRWEYTPAACIKRIVSEFAPAPAPLYKPL
ncbi:MAG: S1 RNA-binding domain-containing protein [Clostridia bacterium]|nr:S1 RNA-binding domain-containing protein [Clostridia bacterium]